MTTTGREAGVLRLPGELSVPSWSSTSATTPSSSRSTFRTAQPTDDTVFNTVLALLAAGIHCEVDPDGKLMDCPYASYHFADGSELTWGVQSITGAENSITHQVSAHGYLGGFYTDDTRDEIREFTTGDFATDAAAFVAWMTELAD
ncbi:hypothetical protein OG613_48885 (plasmid) [Streptomyces sp. NBC_00015]|uniref:hypothetical protein n=1 Tax=Streptomyces sp. NBC_00015 TaxID=2903611 RepID=UPI002F914C57